MSTPNPPNYDPRAVAPYAHPAPPMATQPRQDPFGLITAGLVLVAVGLTFYMRVLGSLRWDDFPGFLLMSLGVAFLLDAGIRAFIADARGQQVGGRVIAGGILLAIGGAFYSGFDLTWPLILVLLGVGLLVWGIVQIRTDEPRGP